jgi:hypothetical protein
MSLSVDTREAVCIELCVLPRGTASDGGWLRIDTFTTPDGAP